MKRSTDESDAPETPRAGSPSRDTERDLEPPARDSGPRPTPRSEASTTMGENTMRSLRLGSDRSSERPDPKTEELERRLTQLEARLRVLELGRMGAVPSDKRWLFWVGLLLALVLGWQLRAYFR